MQAPQPLPDLEAPQAAEPSAGIAAPRDDFEAGPAGAAPGSANAAEPSTQVFDDGSRLYRFPDGRTASLPSAEHHHAFSTQQLAQRLGISEEAASDRLRDLSTRLGPDGDTLLADALATGRMNVGLGGISGPLGGARTPEGLEATRTELSRLSGRQVGPMLDNENGAPQALVAAANRRQQDTLGRLLDFNRDAGITTNVSVHSNGVNALSEALRERPEARLGQVNLVDVNVAGNRSAATEQLRRIVQASNQTSLVTTAYDNALGFSRANGPLSTLIGAAAQAGVQHIRVLGGTDHQLSNVRSQLQQQGPNGPLDFRRDPVTGNTLPVSPQSWASLRYQYTNGRMIYVP